MRTLLVGFSYYENGERGFGRITILAGTDAKISLEDLDSMVAMTVRMKDPNVERVMTLAISDVTDVINLEPERPEPCPSENPPKKKFVN